MTRHNEKGLVPFCAAVDLLCRRHTEGALYFSTVKKIYEQSVETLDFLSLTTARSVTACVTRITPPKILYE